MPNSLIKKIHSQTGKNVASLEKTYKQLEKEARNNKVTNEYAYATAIIEKISGYKPKGK